MSRSHNFPSSVCVRLTRRCNAACSFCQAPDTDRLELTFEQLSLISVRLADLGVHSLKLSGGEPTLRADLPAILRAVHRAGIHPVVVTNGVRLRPDVLDAMADTSAEVKFSVHRPDADNDKVLRIASFPAIVANMATCRYRAIPFSLNTVVTDDTLGLMVPMTQFAIGHGARKISFIPVVPRGRAAVGADHIERDALTMARARVADISGRFAGQIVVRCIDIRNKDYWVIENDGTVWIERSSEKLDVKVCELSALLATGLHTPVGSNRA